MSCLESHSLCNGSQIHIHSGTECKLLVLIHQPLGTGLKRNQPKGINQLQSANSSFSRFLVLHVFFLSVSCVFIFPVIKARTQNLPSTNFKPMLLIVKLCCNRVCCHNVLIFQNWISPTATSHFLASTTRAGKPLRVMLLQNLKI